MKEVLNINFLELAYLQVFVKKIFDYKEKYELHPSPSIMTTILRTEVLEENEVVQKQVRDFFARLLKTEVQDAKYIKDIARSISMIPDRLLRSEYCKLSSSLIDHSEED